MLFVLQAGRVKVLADHMEVNMTGKKHTCKLLLLVYLQLINVDPPHERD